MDKVFSNAAWIWYTQEEAPDTYGDFADSFDYTGGRAVCHISCDGDYTLFVNGAFVSSNQYGDFEHYKIYDSIDITGCLAVGKNDLRVIVWHLGIASSRYRPAKAGLLYAVECGGRTLCQSGAETLSREDPNYKSGYKKIITSQMGQSFLFDANGPGSAPYHGSFVVNKTCQMYSRPICKSVLLNRKETTLLKNEGDHYLIDLGEETVGLPTLQFSTRVPQKITVAWGEHIRDGGVRRKVGGRDFSFEYIAKPGRNSYTNHMLRLGCRYLEVFCEAPIEMEYIGVIPQVYPVSVIPKSFGDPTRQRIYDLCVRTLRLCLMEHYVDTPWREQSFYSFDSRNQMLCGYRVFQDGNRDYARANLLLMSRDDRDDGLLSITCPSGGPLAIPSFSLHYFTAVREYLVYTNDLSLACEVYDKLQTILKAFAGQFHEGLLFTFKESRYWNFYDWSAYMDEPIGATETRADLMLNCLFVLALEHFKWISGKIGRPFAYQSLSDELKANIRKAFFDKTSGLFSMVRGEKQYTALGNAVAILAGLTTEEESRHIAEKLLSGELAECSLSMKCFVYDALLKVDPGYREAIVEEICRTYGEMLADGATSVWEVKEGADAFNKAGSLCHGWSALPVLYL